LLARPAGHGPLTRRRIARQSALCRV
jgi:hypothetical protein